MLEVLPMDYQDPACAYCPGTVRACRQGEAEERGPGFCPSKVDPDTQGFARALYDDPETRRIATESAKVEAELLAARQERLSETGRALSRLGAGPDRPSARPRPPRRG